MFYALKVKSDEFVKMQAAVAFLLWFCFADAVLDEHFYQKLSCEYLVSCVLIPCSYNFLFTKASELSVSYCHYQNVLTNLFFQLSYKACYAVRVYVTGTNQTRCVHKRYTFQEKKHARKTTDNYLPTIPAATHHNPEANIQNTC